MSFNDILEETGGYGLYQKFLTFGFLAFTLSQVAVTYWTQVFILLIPPHRCKEYPNETEWTSLQNFSDVQEDARCHIMLENDTLSGCIHGIIYDFSLHYPTYVTENDLVCENSWKAYLTHTVYWIGTIFGSLVFGFINDKYGRRRAFQCAVLSSFGGDVASFFCKSYIPFVMARFLSATGGGSIATVAYVLAIEHSIPSKRRLLIVVWALSFALTATSMPWIAYSIHNWRCILMFSWTPSAVGTIISYFLPESISWLLTKGRTEEAMYNIQRMGKVNGRPISTESILRHLEISVKKSEKDCSAASVNKTMEKKEQKSKEVVMSSYRTLVTVIKSPKLRYRILCLGFLWLASCACYNGNNLALSFLPFNLYVTYSLGALLETPGTFFVAIFLDRIGRRWTNAGFFIAGGIFGILSAYASSKAVILTFVMLMRTSFASAYDITFSFSSELIPTEIRGRTISFIRVCGGCGSSLAPFVVSLAQNDPLLPLAVFGVVGIIAGLSMLTLPETTHQHLPQTLEDGENFGKEQSFWHCPFQKPRPEKENKDPDKLSIFGKVANPIFETNEEVKCVRIQTHSKY